MELDLQQRGAGRDPFPAGRNIIGLHTPGRAPEQAVQGSSHSPALPFITLGLLPPPVCAKLWKNIAAAWYGWGKAELKVAEPPLPLALL